MTSALRWRQRERAASSRAAQSAEARLLLFLSPIDEVADSPANDAN